MWGRFNWLRTQRPPPNSKHIDIRPHFIRERVATGEFKVVYVPSEELYADFLTKPLNQGSFEVHRNFVMNIRWFLFLVVDIAYFELFFSWY